MRRIIFTLLLVVASTLVTFASFSVIAEPVETETSVFTKRVFTDGTEFFTNRVFLLAGVPTELNGYSFLANNGGAGSLEDVKITAVGDGTVYIIVGGAETVPEGWTLVPSTLTYSTTTPTELKILSLAMTNGETLTLPRGGGFVGSTLLAEDIQYGVSAVDSPDADRQMSQITGVDRKIVIDSQIPQFFSVFDVQGRLILKEMISGYRELEMEQPGIYLVRTDYQISKILVK